MTDKRFGNSFKKCREKKKLTQEQLAELTGLTVNYISSVERGVTFPRYDKLIALFDALEISSDEVFNCVVSHPSNSQVSQLSEEIKKLPQKEQKRVVEIIKFIINQATEEN